MTKEERMVQEFKGSGKSQRVWCEEQGIKRSTLRYWLSRSEELAQGREVLFSKMILGGEGNAQSTD